METLSKEMCELKYILGSRDRVEDPLQGEHKHFHAMAQGPHPVAQIEYG